MRENGFMPFSAAGALIVILVIGVIGHAAWTRHQRSLGAIDDISGSALQTIATGIHGDLQSAVRYSAYRALWEVSKEASRYDGGERKAALESLATEYFMERVAELRQEYPSRDARIRIKIPEGSRWPTMILAEAEGGYVLARAGLPVGSRIKLDSWDESLSLAVPFEDVEVFVDSRYFLLQERMDEFVEHCGDINSLWGGMEYSQAWAGAWLAGRVELNRSRTISFFKAAWSTHEINTFGSSDYWTDAREIFGKLEIGSSQTATDRESFYEILPPPPIKSEPGLSVYHDFEVKSVSYKRVDPAGLLGSPTATPIPLGTTGATLWWGGWDIVIQLEDKPIEEIFDFENPTLPVVHGTEYVHKPLAYRWTLNTESFRIRVAVVSLKPFTILKR